MSMYQAPQRRPIVCQIDGREYKGTYWVAGKIITVTNGRGSKSTQVGSRQVQGLAEQLLREIVA